MKKWNQLLAVLLALSLTAVPAGAVSLRVEGNSANSQLTLQDLDKPVYGVQVELTLDGTYTAGSFTAAGQGTAYGCCTAQTSGGKTTMTIYMDSPQNLNSGGSVALGQLSIGNGALPQKAEVTLLDRDLRGEAGKTQESAAVLDGRTTSSPSPGGSTSSGSSSGGNGESGYAIQIESGRHGTIRATPTSAQKGETVTLTVKPDTGWSLTSLTVTAGKKEVPLTEKGKGTYTFTMPAAGVKVQGTFALEEGGGAPLPFIDVPRDSWFYEAVRYAYEKGIMSGSGEDIFTPNQTTSRGMIVTILYSLEGKPSAGTARFDDVSSSDWFAKAVAWAAANGVVSGYGDGRFGPNDPITREQLALILRGYAKLQGKDVEAEADLSAFADRGEISSYALEAVEWAVARGLISGTSPDTLSPAGRATRAQAAVILKAFCENVIAG